MTHGCSSNTKVHGHIHSLVQPGDSVSGAGRWDVSSSNCGYNSLGPCFKYIQDVWVSHHQPLYGTFPSFRGCSFSKHTARVSASPTASILNVLICPLTARYTFLLFQPLGVDTVQPFHCNHHTVYCCQAHSCLSCPVRWLPWSLLTINGCPYLAHKCSKACLVACWVVWATGWAKPNPVATFTAVNAYLHPQLLGKGICKLLATPVRVLVGGGAVPLASLLPTTMWVKVSALNTFAPLILRQQISVGCAISGQLYT